MIQKKIIVVLISVKTDFKWISAIIESFLIILFAPGEIQKANILFFY